MTYENQVFLDNLLPEFKIINGSISENQQKLNQWRNKYYIEIMDVSYIEEGSPDNRKVIQYITLTRTEMDK